MLTNLHAPMTHPFGGWGILCGHCSHATREPYNYSGDYDLGCGAGCNPIRLTVNGYDARRDSRLFKDVVEYCDRYTPDDEAEWTGETISAINTFLATKPNEKRTILSDLIATHIEQDFSECGAIYWESQILIVAKHSISPVLITFEGLKVIINNVIISGGRMWISNKALRSGSNRMTVDIHDPYSLDTISARIEASF